MKNILALALLLSIQSFAQQSKNVLFLGNSYTYGNNLPGLVESIAQSLGDSLYHALLGTEIVSSIAVDGANRKWFGTRGSGVFLTNSEGTELVKSFNGEFQKIFNSIKLPN